MRVFLHWYKKVGISNAFVIWQLVREQVHREEFRTKHSKEEQSGTVSAFPEEGRSLIFNSQIRREAMQPGQSTVSTTYSFHFRAACSWPALSRIRSIFGAGHHCLLST